MVAYGSAIFIIGGLSNDTNGNATVLSSVVKYDTYLGTVTEVKPMPKPRYRFGHALINGKVYVAGGIITYDAVIPENSVDVYDIATDSWSTLRSSSSPNVPRLDPAGAALDGKVSVLGVTACTSCRQPPLGAAVRTRQHSPLHLPLSHYSCCARPPC